MTTIVYHPAYLDLDCKMIVRYKPIYDVASQTVLDVHPCDEVESGRMRPGPSWRGGRFECKAMGSEFVKHKHEGHVSCQCCLYLGPFLPSYSSGCSPLSVSDGPHAAAVQLLLRIERWDWHIDTSVHLAIDESRT